MSLKHYSKFGLYILFMFLSVIATDLNPYPFYVMMLLTALLADYYLYLRAANMRITSNSRIFLTRVLGGLCELGGVFSLFIGCLNLIIWALQPNSIANGLSIFFVILGMGLLFIGAMLIFRFKMKSGVIVYRE